VCGWPERGYNGWAAMIWLVWGQVIRGVNHVSNPMHFFQYFAVREVDAHGKDLQCRVIPLPCAFLTFAVILFFAVRRIMSLPCQPSLSCVVSSFTVQCSLPCALFC
jgi:hypothetical protein